jgi:hypothetical protein
MDITRTPSLGGFGNDADGRAPGNAARRGRTLAAVDSLTTI